MGAEKHRGVRRRSHEVTLFGQSAGAASVCDIMASPLAKGLFVRAIGESMGCFGGMPKLANAEQAGAEIRRGGECEFHRRSARQIPQKSC